MPSGHSLWSNLTPFNRFDTAMYLVLNFETLYATTTPSLIEL